MTVADHFVPSNSATAITDAAIEDLFVVESQDGIAEIDFSASFEPGNAINDIYWEIVGASPPGHFTGSDVAYYFPLPVTASNRDFEVVVWSDPDHDGQRDEERKVNVHVVALNVSTMNNVNGVNTPGNKLDPAIKWTKGAWVPQNTDNDLYEFKGTTNRPKKDKDHFGKIEYEDDLLPIVITPSKAAGVEYQLIFSGNLQIYKDRYREHPISKTDWFDITTGISNNTLWVEGVGTGVGTITLNGRKGTKEVDNLDKIKINIFQWSGPQDVPGYAKYTYEAKGDRDGAWIGAFQGTKVATGQNSIDILWGEGAVVGNAIYQAAANYKWGYDVNVVKVQIGNGQITTDQGMQANVAITTIQGPNLGDGVSRGVRCIEVGLVQQLEFVAQNVEYSHRFHNGSVDTRVAGQHVGDSQNWLQDQNLLDTITRDINGNTTVRSTMPWYDSKGLTGNSLFQGKVGAVIQNTPAGPLTLRAKDYPRSLPPYNQILLVLPSGAGKAWYRANKVHTDWKFTLQVAVCTTENVNKSADIYTQRAVAGWEYKLTGNANNPTPQWNTLNGGTFIEVKDGTRVDPSQGIGEKHRMVVNDLFGKWDF